MSKIIPTDLIYFWEYVKYWADKNPEFPAIKYRDRITTSAELELKSNQLAYNLIKLGIDTGDRIVTILPPSLEYTLLMIAANKIGAVLVPMDVKYRRSDLARLIPGIEPKLVISIIEDDSINFHDLLQHLIDDKIWKEIDIVFLGDISWGLNYFELFRVPDNYIQLVDERKQVLDENYDFLIIWTGGTTGFPKAAILTNKNVVRMCILETKVLNDSLKIIGVTGNLRYLANLPVSHVGGSVELIGVGIIGGYELLIHERWSSTKTLETIQAEQIAVMLAAPTMYRIMMIHENFHSYDLSSLKLAIISGEVVNQEFIDLMMGKFCDRIINGYGSTEMGPEITFTHIDDDYTKIANGYVGRPLPGVEIKIEALDGTDNKIDTGEILVRGDLVCRGYFGDENHKGFTEDGWFKTGDLGKLDAEGLWLRGRIKEVIRVGTYTVLPMEIEELVLREFELEFAAAISVPDEMMGEAIYLVVATKSGNIITSAEIIDLCKSELASYKVPKKVILYDIDPNNPPMTRIGKIDKRRLRDEILE